MGSVLPEAGEAQLDPTAGRPAAMCTTAEGICSGELDDMTADEAAAALHLSPEMAQQYVERLKDSAEGLVVDGLVDPEALRTVVDLRRRYLPSVVDGVDLLADALVPGSGLLTAGSMHPMPAQ